MVERKIIGSKLDSDTKTRILDTATELFATEGYHAVTMKDIADKVGINPSAIYNHYESKDDLMGSIVSRFEEGYRNYFDWLASVNREAKSPDELLDNLFNKEVMNMEDPIGCLGMALMLKNQHNIEAARDCVFNTIYDMSIDRLKTDFDNLIEMNVIPPNDTRALAMLIMICILVENEMRIYEYKGEKPPLGSMEVLINVRKAFKLLIAGNLNE